MTSSSEMLSNSCAFPVTPALSNSNSGCAAVIKDGESINFFYKQRARHCTQHLFFKPSNTLSRELEAFYELYISKNIFVRALL